MIQGLNDGDLVVQFGSLHADVFKNLNQLKDLVTSSHNVNRNKAPILNKIFAETNSPHCASECACSPLQSDPKNMEWEWPPWMFIHSGREGQTALKKKLPVIPNSSDHNMYF